MANLSHSLRCNNFTSITLSTQNPFHHFRVEGIFLIVFIEQQQTERKLLLQARFWQWNIAGNAHRG